MGGGGGQPLEKSLVRAKGRFGRLHCVWNMKMVLGRMARSFHCSASRVSQGQKVGFLLRTFQFLGEPPPRARSLRGSSPPAQTYFARYLQAGHVAAIFISKRYTARETCASVCPNNVPRKSGPLPFSRDGNYTSSLSPSPFHPPLSLR